MDGQAASGNLSSAKHDSIDPACMGLMVAAGVIQIPDKRLVIRQVRSPVHHLPAHQQPEGSHPQSCKRLKAAAAISKSLCPSMRVMRCCDQGSPDSGRHLPALRKLLDAVVKLGGDEHRALALGVHSLHDMQPQAAAPLHTALLQEQDQPASAPRPCQVAFGMPDKAQARPVTI